MRKQANHLRGTGSHAGQAALALGLAMAVGGCATTGRAGPPVTYTFTIHFDAKGCPRDAQVDQGACSPLQKSCLRASPGDTVAFVASPATTPPTQFQLQFDPFKRGLINVGGGEFTFRIDAPANPGKEYGFSILAGSCAPLDPRIIVQ